MFDAVERARGFRPPIFADIRFSRGVRAAGFRDAAFEELVGRKRYRWMRALGNRAIKDGRPGEMTIAEPAAAADLLHLAVEAAKERRRVVFYCACERPRFEGKPNCHRDLVGSLVLRAAKRDRVPVEVVEWPGGEPSTSPTKVAVDPKVLRSALAGREGVPIGDRAPIETLGALPRGSIVRLEAQDRTVLALLERPAYRRGWVLKLIGPVEADDTLAFLQREARRLRREWGLLARRS